MCVCESVCLCPCLAGCHTEVLPNKRTLSPEEEGEGRCRGCVGGQDPGNAGCISVRCHWPLRRACVEIIVCKCLGDIDPSLKRFKTACARSCNRTGNDALVIIPTKLSTPRVREVCVTSFLANIPPPSDNHPRVNKPDVISEEESEPLRKLTQLSKIRTLNSRLSVKPTNRGRLCGSVS